MIIRFIALGPSTKLLLIELGLFFLNNYGFSSEFEVMPVAIFGENVEPFSTFLEY